MSKKHKKHAVETKAEAPKVEAEEGPVKELAIDPNMPKEAQEKLKDIKHKLEKLQKSLVEKFEGYIMGIALLPPDKPKDEKEKPNDNINVLILVDDTDSKKMSKEELRDKLAKIIETMAHDIDKNLVTQTVILSDLWQNCYDAKYDMLQMIAISAPVYDRGMLAAIKITEIHKTMILKKFEKYIVSYVLAGSLVQGKATSKSDIDVFVVIDDTDVKKMTRAELKDKLRAIIIGMGVEAGEMTGIKNKLNIQVYILTDFWDNIKEANPIIFTFLRDGIPFYDRGIFMPWKQLLKMGKVKPSREAIDMFMSSGDQMLKRVHYKINEIGMEDIYWAILTPSQAALMLYGVPPPTPKETPTLLREVFVKKEKLLEDKYVQILERNIQIRKELEHGELKEISGDQVDKLLKDAEDFLKRINTLFNEIEKVKEEEGVMQTYDTVVTIVRDVLRLEGVLEVDDEEILKKFEHECVNKGQVPEKYLTMLKHLIKAKKDYDNKSLTKNDVEQNKKKSRELIKFLIEHMQRKRGREIERAKIRVKHGDKYGEIILIDRDAFIIHDVDSEEKEITKGTITEHGGIIDIKKSGLEELEVALAKVEIPPKVFIKQPIFEDLKKIFGKDVEVLVNF